LMGQILLTGEEAQHRPALLRDVVADRPAQHRITGLQGVEDRTLRGRACNVELHVAVDVRQCPQMIGKHHSDHGNVWTSTDSTDGRPRPPAPQLSPAPPEAYPCPPVVPK